MPDYRTYLDEDNEEVVFRVFIAHGRSELWRKVERFINKELSFDTAVMLEEFYGNHVIDKLDEMVGECDCAVVILTPDDETKLGVFRGRQNVIHELGYCQGIFPEIYHVVVLKEKSVEFFSNNYGLDVIEFNGNDIEMTFIKLKTALENVYEEYNEDDDDN